MDINVSLHHEETNSQTLGKNGNWSSPCFQEFQRTKECVDELYHKTLKTSKPVVHLMLNVQDLSTDKL